MSKMRIMKWFSVICAILMVAALAPQTVRAILANTLYLPLVSKAEPTPTPTPTLTPTPTKTPTPTQPPVLIVNPSFEQGKTGWVFGGSAEITSAWAYDGFYSAALGNGNNNRTASIAQQFTVPNNAYNLRYYQYTQTNEICGSIMFDYIIISINGIGIQTNNICRDFNGVNNWVINLINYRGDTVVFRMDFYSDDNIGSIAYVDDFAFIP
jgi:hypothetical protein